MNFQKVRTQLALMCLLFVFVVVLFIVPCANLFASVYPLPNAPDSLIGQTFYRVMQGNDSLTRITRHYDVGRNAIENANPQLNGAHERVPAGAVIQIPTQHLLPNEKRQGIVVNLPEMRMYYFAKDNQDSVFTYPIGIGKVGKTIPIERARVTRKTKDPIWVPPDDIRQFNLDQGIVLPKVMPAGPDNPLGPYAIYMSIPTYLIHSTTFPDSIGKRASFGCIRMYEWDIREFFPSVDRGIPVVIINAPTKVGWQKDQLYMEAHQPLSEHRENYDASLDGMVHLLAHASLDQPTLIDWQMVSYIAEHRDGIPHAVGIRIAE